MKMALSWVDRSKLTFPVSGDCEEPTLLKMTSETKKCSGNTCSECGVEA